MKKNLTRCSDRMCGATDCPHCYPDIIFPVPERTIQQKVEKHIYGINGGCEVAEEWIALAISALDQAGATVKYQKEVQKQLECDLL